MISLKAKTLGAFAILFIAIYMPHYSVAVGELNESDINVETIPDNPQPYADVTIKISSYSTDLDKAMIEWRSGSSMVLSGYGKTSFSFKALGPNTITIFDVTITPSDGNTPVTKRIAVNPSEITLLWESVDGYTPPFYRGKSFSSAEGMIRVVAIPNTNTIKSGKGSITYVWKTDDDTVQNASGFNKDSYVFKNNVLHTKENVTVLASSVDGRYSATGSITIPIITPRIIFYKKSPTEGILYNEALTDQMTVTEDEVTVIAEPYYLAIKGNESDFTYSWQINGEDITTPSKKTELTVQPTARGGYATINVIFENLNALFQKVSGQLKLNL